VRATVGRRVPPLRCMHLRGILWVFFRVLLVGFGLFGPGAARAQVKNILSTYNCVCAKEYIKYGIAFINIINTITYN